MDELKVTKENALAAHAEANQKGKSLLENLFGPQDKFPFRATIKKSNDWYEFT